MQRSMLCVSILICASACTRAPTATPDQTNLPPATTTPAPAAQPAPQPAPSAPAATLDGVDALLVLPGAFSPTTTLDDLHKRFGAKNVQQAEVPGAEGETSDGVILFPDDPTRRAYLYYDDAQKMTALSTIRVLDEGSRWRLDEGVAIGMPLSDLVALNGKPIRFYGMEWDYGGTITEWNGGKLAPAKDGPVWYSIRLGPLGNAVDRSYPSGDGEFSSDDRKFPKIGDNVVVAEIGISFPGGENQSD